MMLRQKIEREILSLYGGYKGPHDAFIEMMDRIMNEISKEVYGKQCLWSRADDDTDMWETSCDQVFYLMDGTPKENDFKFCAYCGGSLIEDSDCTSVEEADEM